VPAGVRPSAGSGVTGTLGTFARADGSLQVTYGGRALYYFASDKQAGDTTGQGVGGVWFVALVAGNSAGGTGASPSAAGASPSANGGSSY
jgi:hypothetical protein